MIDLNALRKVLHLAARWGWEGAYRQDVTALVAEVERLQSRVADCEQHAKFATEKAAALERAAVVAWLRAWQGQMDDRITHDDADYAIRVIERGWHRREGEK